MKGEGAKQASETLKVSSDKAQKGQGKNRPNKSK